MTRYEAERTAKQMLLSGYRHHSYEDEKARWSLYFNGQRRVGYEILDVPDSYLEILGPDRTRSGKNALICLITIVCRAAIDHGVDAELSFALSDYYINELEKLTSEEALYALVNFMMDHYYDLVQQARTRRYSRTVAKAVRYIGRMVYEPCSVAAVARHAGVTPAYLAQLFKAEVGATPSAFIRRTKMDEAHRLLRHQGFSITETADALGYCDPAHFSHIFKGYYGVSPLEYCQAAAL